ncbi:pol polyprotein [Penaeus vannamei]|uniref:RNA-directed DNA polymerase n=1 Tax=Penaeus vannamei TaxID=6689 RepID=A0A3R7MJN3_PENVA|nr:pol polyprotein [Penaeus vannamei]
MVYQGLRDYPRAIGDPDDLIRRVFLQGLPRWIREAVVVKEEAELCNLVRLPREFGVSGKVKVLGSGVAATPSLASKEVLSTTDCDNEVLQKPAGRPMVSLMVNGFKTQCFVDTGSEVAHVAVPAFVPPRSGRFVKCSVPRYAAEEQALGTELFMGNDNDFELDVDLPPCSVVTQTPVGVDQSGSSTDCPEDVQLKDAELGDLLSEIDLGHLTLEQQQQLRQLSRAVAATELHNRDPDDLRRHQLEDPLWKEVIEYLEERNLPRRRLPLTLEEFELRDGVLYHVRHLPDRVLHQLVVPKTLRGSAMHLAHSSATAGHPGVYRTYCKLRDYFYFPNMLAAVKEYVGTCRSCQKRKGMAYRAPLAAAPQASYPLERVSADLMELEVTSQGNRYVLAFIDQLTRYVQLIPLPSKDAETVADAFINQFVTVFGPPRLLQTDNGREFKNNLFKRVCELASVQTIFTTAFHPQANGMIERTNRVVKNALATLLEASPLEWDELLPYVRLAMNSAVHRSLRRAREIAVETSVQAREGWARDYNRRTRKSTFAAEVGDLVLFKDLPRMAGAGRRGALGPRWFGPARICKKTGPVTRLTGSRRMILQLLSWLPFADLLTMPGCDCLLGRRPLPSSLSSFVALLPVWSCIRVMFLVLYGPFESIRSVEPFLRRVVDGRGDRELLLPTRGSGGVAFDRLLSSPLCLPL